MQALYTPGVLFGRAPFSKLKEKFQLAPRNAHEQAYMFYVKHLHPRPAPHFNTILKYMIESGSHLPSSEWANRHKQFDAVAAELLWSMTVNCAKCTTKDSAALFFFLLLVCQQTWSMRGYRLRMPEKEPTSCEPMGGRSMHPTPTCQQPSFHRQMGCSRIIYPDSHIRDVSFASAA